jgi:hypothetical protein
LFVYFVEFSRRLPDWKENEEEKDSRVFGKDVGEEWLPPVDHCLALPSQDVYRFWESTLNVRIRHC